MFEKFLEFMEITDADIIDSPEQFLKVYSGYFSKRGYTEFMI